jgi:hypothetical protein
LQARMVYNRSQFLPQRRAMTVVKLRANDC